MLFKTMLDLHGSRKVAKQLFRPTLKAISSSQWGRQFLIFLVKQYTLKHFEESNSILLFENVLNETNFQEFCKRGQIARLKTDVLMELDISDVDQRKLFFFEITEPEITNLFKKRLQKGDVFIDIGANVGYYSLLAGKLLGNQGKVIAFEPNPLIYNHLSRNIQINNLGDVITTFQSAVGEQLGKLNIYRSKGNWSGITSRFKYSDLLDDSSLEVPMVTLDEIVIQEKFEKVSLIKLDIEGGELLALKGSRETLKTYSPDIIAEVSPKLLNEVGVEPKEIFQFLWDLEYRAYSIQKSEYVFIEPELTLNIPEQGNVYFTKRDFNG